MDRLYLILAFACFFTFFIANFDMAEAKEAPSGQKLFQQHCSSCHLGGGNKIKSGKDLAGSKELRSLLTFKEYLSKPPGHMPYYQHVVTNQKVLDALYQYCKTLKKTPISQATNGYSSL